MRTPDLLTPSNCALIFIDHQPQMFFGVAKTWTGNSSRIISWVLPGPPRFSTFQPSLLPSKRKVSLGLANRELRFSYIIGEIATHCCDKPSAEQRSCPKNDPAMTDIDLEAVIKPVCGMDATVEPIGIY